MVLYHWSQSTRLVREGALGPLSFIYERQYTEQFVDNQQEQKTVNLAELKQLVNDTYALYTANGKKTLRYKYVFGSRKSKKIGENKYYKTKYMSNLYYDSLDQ